jgi:hypothetical protein
LDRVKSGTYTDKNLTKNIVHEDDFFSQTKKVPSCSFTSNFMSARSQPSIKVKGSRGWTYKKAIGVTERVPVDLDKVSRGLIKKGGQRKPDKNDLFTPNKGKKSEDPKLNAHFNL